MPAPTSPVVRALALGVVTMLALSACGGDGGTTDDGSLHLAFDGDNCTYDGPTDLVPGPVELVFHNDSDDWAAVNMVVLDEGYTIQDVIDDLGPEPSTGHHPPWTHELGTWQPIQDGERHVWTGDLEEGLYAMVCARTAPLGVWFGTGLTVAE